AEISFSTADRQTDVIYARLKPYGQRDQNPVFWFSDFQRSAFDPTFFSKNDTVSEVHLVKLKPAATNNIFIDSVALEDELVLINENSRHLVKLQNQGSEAKKNVSLKLFIGNRQAATTVVSMEANAAVNTQLDFRLSGPGLQQAWLEIEDQPVTFDNRYYFTLDPATEIQILDISQAALNSTSRLFTNEPVFKYQVIDPRNVSSERIAQTDVVLLNEVSGLNGALVDNLSKYVKEGGNLVII